MPPSRRCPISRRFSVVAARGPAVPLQDRPAAPPPAAPAARSATGLRACSTCATPRRASSTGSPARRSKPPWCITSRRGVTFPENYLELLKLRMPPYVKIVLANEFPRSQLTTHLTRCAGLYFGPFRSRASAERFESQFLDLFQMRRCQEDLKPSPEHPGCIYGEMGMCLRPCQEVVGPAEYAARSGPRGGVSAQRRPIAAGFDRPLARPPERGDALRRGRPPAQALREGDRGAEAARRAGARCGPAERRGHHPVAWRPMPWNCGSCARAICWTRGGSVSKCRRARPCRWTGGCAKSWPAPEAPQADGPRAAGVNWRCWPAGITPAGATASGWISKGRKACRIASWCTPSRAWRGRSESYRPASPGRLLSRPMSCDWRWAPVL